MIRDNSKNQLFHQHLRCYNVELLLLWSKTWICTVKVYRFTVRKKKVKWFLLLVMCCKAIRHMRTGISFLSYLREMELKKKLWIVLMSTVCVWARICLKYLMNIYNSLCNSAFMKLKLIRKLARISQFKLSYWMKVKVETKMIK